MILTSASHSTMKRNSEGEKHGKRQESRGTGSKGAVSQGSYTLEVMLLCTEDDDREWIKRRRETCLENVKRPPVKVEDFGDMHKAVTETQHRMGIAQPNGNAFRLNGGKKQRQATIVGDCSQ